MTEKTVLKETKIPPVEEIIKLYEKKYPPEVIRVVYSDITHRVRELASVVKDNGSKPLVSRGGWDTEADVVIELEKKVVSNQSARDAFEDYQFALERLISGKLGECVECRGEIGAGRLMAIPSTSKCAGCKQKNPIRVLR